MAFDFPNAPTTGQVANGYQWDGEKWKGGVPGVAGPQKEQFFDCSGKTAQDIPVPTWAKACEIEGYAVPISANSWLIMRYSIDGTTFLAGAADYAYNGFQGNSGTTGWANLGWPNSNLLYLTFAGDAPAHPHHFVANITLTRPDTSRSLGMMQARSQTIDTGTSTQARLFVFGGYMSQASSGSVLGIKAIRIMQGSGAALPAGSWLKVKWLGDDAQLPVSNAIPDCPSDGGEYVRVNGVWRQRSLFKEGATQYDFTPPDYAKRGRATVLSRCTTSSSMSMRVSVDGTNYFAGASDYTFGGFIFYTGSLTAPIQQSLVPSSVMQLTLVTDNVSLPQQAVVDFNIQKSNVTASSYFSRGMGYSNGAQYLYSQFHFTGYSGNATITAATALKGFRFFTPSVESHCLVEWFG